MLRATCRNCAIVCGMTSARMGLVALALFIVPAVAPAQTNRVEKTIPYRLDVSTKVDAKVVMSVGASPPARLKNTR